MTLERKENFGLEEEKEMSDKSKHHRDSGSAKSGEVKSGAKLSDKRDAAAAAAKKSKEERKDKVGTPGDENSLIRWCVCVCALMLLVRVMG